MQAFKCLWNQAAVQRRIVDHDRQNKGDRRIDTAGPVDRIVPLSSEIPLSPAFGVTGNKGHKQGTLSDIALNLDIVIITCFQTFFVEPDAEPGAFTLECSKLSEESTLCFSFFLRFFLPSFPRSLVCAIARLLSGLRAVNRTYLHRYRGIRRLKAVSCI